MTDNQDINAHTKIFCLIGHPVEHLMLFII